MAVGGGAGSKFSNCPPWRARISCKTAISSWAVRGFVKRPSAARDFVGVDLPLRVFLAMSVLLTAAPIQKGRRWHAALRPDEAPKRTYADDAPMP